MYLFSLIFFLIFSDPFYMTDCIFIFTHCNLNAILTLIVMNNIKKQLIMITPHYENQITTNQKQYQTRWVTLILTINKSKYKINPN